MSKKNSQKQGASDEAEAPKVNKQRIAIFMRKWMQTASYAPHTYDRHFKCWNAGQIVWKEADIEELLTLNAPIKVFIEDVDGCAER